MASVRNWKIELLRFFFAISIVVCHFYNLLPATGNILPGVHANLGVEFFFIVSGYLLAKKIMTSEDEISIPELLKRKLLSFYGIWVIAVALMIALYIIFAEKCEYVNFFSDLFLLYGFGFSGVNMPHGWFLSSMMIVTALLAPLIIKIRKRGKIKQDLVYLAMADLLLIGLLFVSGNITGVTDMLGIFMKCNVRALADMLLGVILYAFRYYVREPREGAKAVRAKAAAIIAQVVSYAYLIYFMNTTSEVFSGEFIALACFAVIVYFAFEEKPEAPGNKVSTVLTGFCITLGKLSLPIYIFHPNAKYLVLKLMPDYNPYKQLMLIILISVVLAGVVVFAKQLIRLMRSGGEKTLKGMMSPIAAAAICAAVCLIINSNFQNSAAIFRTSQSFGDKSSTVKCYTGTTVSEDFYVEESSLLSSISFYTITWNNEFEPDQQLNIVVRNKELDSEVYSEAVDMSAFTDAKIYSFVPAEKAELPGNCWYTVEFVPTTSEDQKCMALMMTRESTNTGSAYINGKATDEHIAMNVYTTLRPSVPAYSRAVDNSLSYSDKSSTIKCFSGVTAEERFHNTEAASLEAIRFYAITWHKEFADDQVMKIVVKNADTNEQVYDSTVKMSEFRDGKAFSLRPDENVALEADCRYSVEFIPTTADDQEFMALLTTKSSDNSDGALYLNGERTDEHISMQVITRGA